MTGYNYVSMWRGQIKFGDIEVIWARIEKQSQGHHITLRTKDTPVPNGELVIRSKDGKTKRYTGCKVLSVEGDLVEIKCDE